MADIPITTGTGSASVATELVGARNFQLVEIVGQGGASTLSINTSGAISTTFSGSPSISGAVTVVGNVNASVVGIVPVTQSGTFITSLVSTTPSSVQVQVVGDSNNGTADISNRPVGIGGRYLANPGTYTDGNRATVLMDVNGRQVVNLSNTSVISVSQGSVAAATTITSIATANGGLPIYAPLSAWLNGTADFRGLQGASVAVIGAQGAGVRNYIKHVQIANYGSSSVLVTIADNTTSILGYTIAPAGGGSNYDTFYRGAANSPITASINGTASVLVSMQGFTSST